jgi:hypothetical protein
VQRKIENWRNQVVAHHTITSDFNIFYEMNVVSFDDIERVIGELDEILHIFAIPPLSTALSGENRRCSLPSPLSSTFALLEVGKSSLLW